MLLVIIACSSDDDSNPLSPDQVSDNSVSTSSTSSTTSSDTSSSSSSTTSSDNSSNSTEISIETITSYFSAFTDVSITSDDSYFYINSYSWPNHQMGIGITSWQEQVPVPQNYTGDNSWKIPLNPVKDFIEHQRQFLVMLKELDLLKQNIVINHHLIKIY